MEQLNKQNFVTIEDIKYEISDDQNEIRFSDMKLKFFEFRKAYCCPKCFLYRMTCDDVPCESYRRIDNKNGYYSIHEMPNN